MAIVLQLRNVADYDAPKTGRSSDFTIVKDGDGIKISHDCKQSYDSSYEEFETIAKSVTFTKSTKPSTGTDAFAGTWVCDSLKWIFDGKGNVSDENGNSYAYTITGEKAVFNNSSYTVTCTLSGDSISVYYDDGFGEDCFTKTFTKQA